MEFTWIVSSDSSTRFGFRRTRYSGYEELATSFPQQWPERKLGLSKLSSSTLKEEGGGKIRKLSVKLDAGFRPRDNNNNK